MKPLMIAALAACLAVPVQGSINLLLVPDEVSKASEVALRALAEGRPRAEIVGPLVEVAAKHPKSPWHESAMILAKELTQCEANLQWAAAEGSTKESEPWRWLADSRMPAHYPYYPESRNSLRQFMDEHRDDPATLLMMGGSGSIEKLLPLLTDQTLTRTPTLSYLGGSGHGERVCDLALGIIEGLSGCSFCETRIWMGTFSGLEDGKTRLQARESAEAWWKESGHLSYNEGIRAHLPAAGYYGTIRMAGLLAETGNAEDLKFARRALRKLVNQGYGVARAAEALWDLGDRHGVDVLRRTYEKRLKRGAAGYIVDDEDAFFLAHHGGRAEWEVLNRYAEEVVKADADDAGRSLFSVFVNRLDWPDVSPYAIPALGLMVSSSGVPALSDFWYGEDLLLEDTWKAALALQQLTGEKLGVPEAEPADEEKKRTVEVVRAWWEAKGKARYTFDEIERRKSR